VEVRLLGPLEVRLGDGPVDLGPRKQRAVLAMLALEAGRTVPVDRLAEGVWGDPPPPSAAKMVQLHVSHLRRVLDGDRARIVTRGRGYELQLADGEVDAVRAARLLEESRPRDALALWHGEPLADLADTPFAAAEIRRLQELRLRAAELAIDADLSAGRHAELITEIDTLVAANPLRERLHAQRMLALYRAHRQSEALAAYRTARAELVEQIGVEPGAELQRLHEQILAHDPALDLRPAAALGAGALPPAPNRTIGRDDEVRRIASQIRTSAERLLTLTGPGGVGKTRLALEAARAAAADFEHGARFISLSGVRRGGEVSAAVVSQLAIVPLAGETAHDAVERFLADQRILLVLDNAEHVLAAAADVVAGVIASCRAVSVLATSRAPLSLAGERCWPVAPLELPDRDADVGGAAPAGAVELFVERVCARDPAFRLDEHTAGAVTDICRHVDGLPLGIELAAARCGLLSPAEMAERLGGALTPLGEGPRDAPARQRTLHATIDWSYQLLSDAERRCFVRFAVFRGGATIVAAEEVTQADLETLERLVAQSLLARRAGPAGTRLVMLETIRVYAADRLHQSSEREAVHERHYRHFLAAASRHGSERVVFGRAHREHLEALDADVDNLHAALDWATDRRDAERALALVVALGGYWTLRNRHAHALERCDAALALPGADAYPALRVQALMRRAHSGGFLGRGLGLPETEEAESIARALGDPLLLSEALRFRADRENIANRPHVAAPYADEALSWATVAGDRWAMAYAAHMKATAVTTIDELRERVPRAASLLDEVGHVFGIAGLLNRAVSLALEFDSVADAMTFGDRALEITRELDGPLDWMNLQTNVGLAALLDGDIGTARRAVRQALKLSRELAVPLVVRDALRVLAAVAVIGDDLARAARLVGAAATHKYEPVDDDRVGARLDTTFFQPARSRYGEAAWDDASTEGAALNVSDAIAYALEETHPPH
jgi:predicted ATPase/DNA-binding SARP family transcriptional activator